MKLTTEIGLSKPQIFVFPKENTTPLNIAVTEDLTSDSLKFVVKLTKEIASPVLILKQTGNMTITDDNVALTILNTDTLPCEIPVGKKKQRFVWSLKDISDEKVKAWGYIILVKTVQSDYDILNPPLPLTAGQLVFTLKDENSYTHDLTEAINIEKNTFSATIKADLNDTGKYTIHSDIAIFIPANDIEITFLAAAAMDTYNILQSCSDDGFDLYLEITALKMGGYVDRNIRIKVTEVIL